MINDDQTPISKCHIRCIKSWSFNIFFDKTVFCLYEIKFVRMLFSIAFLGMQKPFDALPPSFPSCHRICHFTKPHALARQSKGKFIVFYSLDSRCDSVGSVCCSAYRLKP
jgi:hypothetical protein